MTTPNDATESFTALDQVIAAYLQAVEAGEVPNRQDLLDNLPRFKVSFEPLEPAGAEPAAISASHLRRNAKGVPITRLAVKSRIGRKSRNPDSKSGTHCLARLARR